MLICGAVMITPRQIKTYLEAMPFRPFRLFLSDGSRHEVPHPEFAWVFGSSVFVGVAGNGARQPDMYVKELSQLHVTRIEKVSARKSK